METRRARGLAADETNRTLAKETLDADDEALLEVMVIGGWLLTKPAHGDDTLRRPGMVEVGRVKVSAGCSAERQADSGDEVRLAGVVRADHRHQVPVGGQLNQGLLRPKLLRLRISMRSNLTHASLRHAVADAEASRRPSPALVGRVAKRASANRRPHAAPPRPASVLTPLRLAHRGSFTSRSSRSTNASRRSASKAAMSLSSKRMNMSA